MWEEGYEDFARKESPRFPDNPEYMAGYQRAQEMYEIALMAVESIEGV